MRAYLLDDYYLFTDYRDLASHIYDVVHSARPNIETGSHSFTVMTGEVYWDQLLFVNDQGDKMHLKYEQEYHFYYCTVPMDDYSIKLSKQSLS